MRCWFLSVFFSFIGLFDYFCTDNDVASSNEVNISGGELEIFGLNKGINDSNIVINKDVELDIDGKYFIYSDKVEKIGFKGNVKNKKKVYFTGSPVVRGKDLELSSNEFIFDIPTKVLKMSGDVNCRYKNIIFRSDSCNFDANKNIFSFRNKGTLIVNNISISSETGDFNIDTNKFVLKKKASVNSDNFNLFCDFIEITNGEIRCVGNVKLIIKDRNITVTTKDDVLITNNNNIVTMSRCLAESDEFIFYGTNITVNRESKSIFVNNGVEILNKDNYWITARTILFNYSTNRGSITGNDLIEIKNDDESGNIYISSDLINFSIIKPKSKQLEPDVLDKFNIYSYGNVEFFSKEDDENNNVNVVKKSDVEDLKNIRGTFLKGSPIAFTASGNVELWSKNLKIKSDGFTYKNSRIKFTNKILIWQGNNRLTSNEAVVYFGNGIEKVILRNKPFVALFKDIYPSQIKSDEIYIGFKNSKLNKILFNKDVETLLYIFDKSELRYVNNLKTNSLCVLFDKKLIPFKALFNKNSGRIITFDEISKNSDLLFMDRYNELTGEAPKFDNISRRIVKRPNMPASIKKKFLSKKK